MMPEFVCHSEPGPACRVVGVNAQQRRLTVVRAQPVTSALTEGTERDVSGKVHLNQRRKVAYLRDAKLKVATHLFGKDTSLALRFRRSPRRSRETRGDQPLDCSPAR